nr:hypothetical protein BgiMline_020239 [Biomphalaria glabrata]
MAARCSHRLAPLSQKQGSALTLGTRIKTHLKKSMRQKIEDGRRSNNSVPKFDSEPSLADHRGASPGVYRQASPSGHRQASPSGHRQASPSGHRQASPSGHLQ